MKSRAKTKKYDHFDIEYDAAKVCDAIAISVYTLDRWYAWYRKQDRLLHRQFHHGQKVIIYSQWTSVTDEVRRRLAKSKISYAIITGQNSSEINHAFEKKFQEDPNCMVCVGTIGALGTGFTLTAATAEIFLDEPWNMKEKEQAEDRAHRIGTTEPLTIITLLTKDTIDERINELVYKKGMMADMMVDGQIDMSNPEVIDYLLN